MHRGRSGGIKAGKAQIFSSSKDEGYKLHIDGYSQNKSTFVVLEMISFLRSGLALLRIFYL